MTWLSEEWHRLQPAVVAVCAIVAIALVNKFLVAVPVVGPNRRAFSDLVEYRVWSGLAAISLVVWVLVVFRTGDVALRPFRDKDLPLRSRVVRGAVPVILYLMLAAAVLFGAASVTGLGLVGSSSSALGDRVALVTIVAVGAAGAPVTGMWHSYARFRDLASALRGRGRSWTAWEFAKELRDAWADAQRCLGGLAILVGFGTVLTGALRNTLLAAGHEASVVPASAVLAYGAFLTILSLIVYVPLYLAWRHRVDNFVDRLYLLPDTAQPTEQWTNDRARLLTFLGADTTLGKNLTAAAGILAPLATSVLTVFLPKADLMP